MPIVTLLTDFGTDDAYVGQMKGQILSICPTAQLIDISHSVRPQDLFHGSLLLTQAAPFFPEDSIHIAVVDPGVGSQRRILAVELSVQADSAEVPRNQRFVLPDNGLIGPLVQRSRRFSANQVTESRYFRSQISSTFHGRDIMGPVAAHWANGVQRNAFGPSIDRLEKLEWPEAIVGQQSISGRVLAIDHFGNVITNIPCGLLRILHIHRWSLSIAGRDIDCRLVKTYADQPSGGLVILGGSHDQIEVALVNGHAACELGCQTGNPVEITFRDPILPLKAEG